MLRPHTTTTHTHRQKEMHIHCFARWTSRQVSSHMQCTPGGWHEVSWRGSRVRLTARPFDHKQSQHITGTCWPREPPLATNVHVTVGVAHFSYGRQGSLVRALQQKTRQKTQRNRLMGWMKPGRGRESWEIYGEVCNKEVENRPD